MTYIVEPCFDATFIICLNIFGFMPDTIQKCVDKGVWISWVRKCTRFTNDIRHMKLVPSIHSRGYKE